jgi:hypothetical protein
MSTFTLIFPSEIMQITPPTQPLLVNSNYALLNSTPIPINYTVSFSNLQAITMNSSIVISISIRSPTYVATFSSIQLIVAQGNTVYFQSLNSMSIKVTAAGVMPITISPVYSITGAISPYLITLTLTIPHPSIFSVKIDVGNDCQFISGGAACTNICSGLTLIGNNSFTVSVNNPYPNSLSPVNIVLNITTFMNSRNIGPGLSWNVTTSTVSSNQISYQTNFPIISVPNLLIGILKTT